MLGKECETCKKIGHFATVCNASKAAVRVVGSGMRIGMIANGKAARKVPKISINLCNSEGQSLAVASAIPDCGAEASVMGVAILNIIDEDAGNLLHRNTDCLVAANGQAIKSVGRVELLLRYKDRETMTPVIVCPEKSFLLLASNGLCTASNV